MADDENALGSFLRARRERLAPELVGVPDLGRRRVSGLRREEIAHLAGVSATYYARLEQGRDRCPSAEVVDAIARALRLDDDATRHPHRLATPPPRAAADESFTIGGSPRQTLLLCHPAPGGSSARALALLAALASGTRG